MSDEQLPQLMDQIYRYERFIFDLTRPLILIGRDKMLHGVEVKPGEHVLEIGVGTARNLLKLHDREPGAHYYGVDVSALMLETAEKKLRKTRAAIVLRHLTSQPSDYRAEFGLNQGFDHIILSYCLTMMENPLPVLDAALKSLNPGGTLHVADYYDKAVLPAPVRRFFTFLHNRYHVRYNADAVALLKKSTGKLELSPTFLHISYLARFTKSHN